MAVALHHHSGFKPPNRSQRCRLQSFTNLDFALADLPRTGSVHHSSSEQALEITNVHRCFSTPCLSLTSKVEDDFDMNPRIEIVGGNRDPRARALVVEVAIAMASGINIVPVSEGLGGAYILQGRNGHNIALAKPIDEEPLAFNNPKGFGALMLGQPGLQRSVRVGETGLRELAACLLDHDGFAGVPPTALAKISHVPFHVNDASGISPVPFKIASLQRFVDHDLDAGELGPSSFSVASVHQVGIFDVRLLNLDRHAGNILVKKYEQGNCSTGSLELIPIDHGLCLPEWLDDPYFEWLHWPQASVPFSDSEFEYISNLDPFKDADLLRAEIPNLRESSIRVLVVCTIFLKQAAAAGLCLADIGEMMTRSFSGKEEKLSFLENFCLQVKKSMESCFILDEENHWTEEEVDDTEMIQFDVEIEDGYDETDLDTKPAKILRFSSLKSMTALLDLSFPPQCDETDQFIPEYDAKTTEEKVGGSDINGTDKFKKGVLPRSMSFQAQKHINDSGGISFGDMSEDEWDLFLESFAKLLPEVIENWTCKGLKQRLGTSCEF
ncbi:phosphatidylinositol 4-kinase gamma 8-like [Punica granatum]|uniref:1-phosphatidylinositol 4-kinase n=2 Tax=Punica granatum TaxID=22663 RepID=A0A218X115_PUNGR|nr:phosphatidylinositol 4-kinase gamma 8-like [Punica granatum]OWM78875.1 hypothetical protein CDL15_Pgr003046 [Punica granatum]PKI31932.1 hypothetical protein CRG98_047650 [Punica granatum]